MFFSSGKTYGYFIVRRYWHFVLCLNCFLLLVLWFYISNDRPQRVLSSLQATPINVTKVPSINERIEKIFPVHAPVIFALANLTQKTTAYQRLGRLLPLQSDEDRWIDEVIYDQDPKKRYACDNQDLPYPILKRIITQTLPVRDPQTAYEHAFGGLKSPFLLLPFKRSTHLIRGQTICIRAIIPNNVEEKTNDPFHFLYQPYDNVAFFKKEGPWWDTMMVSLNHKDADTSMPVHMKPWPGHEMIRYSFLAEARSDPSWWSSYDFTMIERTAIHIYEGEIEIHDSGTYSLEGLLEYTGGQWNFEKGPVLPYKPTAMQVLPTGTDTFHVKQSLEEHTTDVETATNILNEHLNLPLCKGADHAGRWLSWPGDPQHAIQRVAGLNRHNKFWAPYNCRYRHITYPQFNRCLARKYSLGIEAYGDSNMRRSIKKFLSRGRWCRDWSKRWQMDIPLRSFPANYTTPMYASSPADWKWTMDDMQPVACYCEDYQERSWNRAWFDPMTRRNNVLLENTPEESDALGWDTEWDSGSYDVTTRDGAILRSYKWDGLTALNNPSWESAFTDGNATSTGRPDIAIFSLGNWDATYMRFEDFVHELDKLNTHIHARFIGPGKEDGRQTTIIYRTAQYYCCRVDNTVRRRRLNSDRVRAFDSFARMVFKNLLNAVIWDTFTMGESQTLDVKKESIQCASNHAAADHVEIENQVLMNSLCNS
ncbi:uncharacterized protein BYT42DRAFT_504122 [Radiomyces spectabilis]|uniref:uncharacterized protein n=1 Tax=Radiomyces spectabilis TaxID=64574 RepID=UPI00221FBAA2|nr:uncharacterized protein BYT42DRAFT_504122 [Radiomyces spectabilis]KAI8368216.1 hypothetical protein BYT42DRAFT_504122 [Radiomyces spectabilis]